MTTTTSIDDVRHALCREITRMCRKNTFRISFRVNRQNGQPTELCCYGHRGNKWVRQTPLPFNAAQLALATDELDRLATNEHADHWTLRQRDFADRRDYDLNLNRDAVAAHVENGLESYMFGLMFYERPGLQQSRRRTLRRRPGSARTNQTRGAM